MSSKCLYGDIFLNPSIILSLNDTGKNPRLILCDAVFYLFYLKHFFIKRKMTTLLKKVRKKITYVKILRTCSRALFSAKKVEVLILQSKELDKCYTGKQRPMLFLVYFR